MPLLRPRTQRAFTLVELLVVIGIIAVLIGVLLPVLAGVSARGRDIKCQSNLRQIAQATLNYCTENKGSMPYGFYFNRSNDRLHPDPSNSTNNWVEHSSNVNGEYQSWAGLVGRYMSKSSSGIDDNIQIGVALRNVFPPVLQCPEAAQARNHVVGYVMNFIVGVSPIYEWRIGAVPPQGQTRPPKQTLMLKETALFWDTGIRPNWSESSGHLTGADIDDERFWRGAHTPQFRYYSVRDIFGVIPPGLYGQNKPVILSVGSNVFFNKDPNTSALERWPYQGNLRFRHGKNTTCNVAMADGSVRQFTAKLESDRLRVKSHDALRRYFMIKWPPGVPPNANQPF
jgi:prepilin-type N-terminal cleavage/methylation domain-containing protein/prepilin-type processing-associated H-X9-DG protein